MKYRRSIMKSKTAPKLFKLTFSQGFTLPELLVVMAIIAILAAVIAGGLRNSQLKGKDAQRKADLNQIAKSLEMFYADYKQYPLGNAEGVILGCPFDAAQPNLSTECVWGADELTDGKTTYFRQIPKDPSSRTGGLSTAPHYFYRTLNNGQAFQIFAHLENINDRNCLIKNVDDGKPLCEEALDFAAEINCGLDLVCNFAITSANVSPFDN